MFLVYCHNCGYSHSLEVFLKENFPGEYKNLKSHIIDSLADGSYTRKDKRQPIVRTMTDAQINDKLRYYLPSVSFDITTEQSDARLERYRGVCVKYLIDRRIPETIFRDFICIHGGPLAGYVGIPFFDESKTNLLHVQGRLVIPNKKVKQAKYMFLKDVDNGIELEGKPIWGQWRVKKDRPIIVCEGTLDACAFENGIATCGATLSETFIRKVKTTYKNRIWCVDNYWLDKAGADLTNRLIELDEDCMIIPKEYNDIKDANDIIRQVFKDEIYIPESFAVKNVYNKKNASILIMKS